MYLLPGDYEIKGLHLSAIVLYALMEIPRVGLKRSVPDGDEL
jgi:hypothetical protein